MTQPRSTLVSIDTTPRYHVISRCVRHVYGVSPRRGLPTDLRASVMIGPCIVYRHAIQWDQ